jgi:hypothetical protein
VKAVELEEGGTGGFEMVSRMFIPGFPVYYYPIIQGTRDDSRQ